MDYPLSLYIYIYIYEIKEKKEKKVYIIETLRRKKRGLKE